MLEWGQAEEQRRLIWLEMIVFVLVVEKQWSLLIEEPRSSSVRLKKTD